jgi:hypothetical protein
MTFETRESVFWEDNIGNTVKTGDLLFTLNNKYNIEVVNKLSSKCETFGYEPTVVFPDGRYMYSIYVISLSALGIDGINEKNASKTGFDAIGNSVKAGDYVLSVQRLKMYARVGRILKIANATCLIEDDNGETHRRRYREIISLTAIGKENIKIEHEYYL